VLAGVITSIASHFFSSLFFAIIFTQGTKSILLDPKYKISSQYSYNWACNRVHITCALHNAKSCNLLVQGVKKSSTCNSLGPEANKDPVGLTSISNHLNSIANLKCVAKTVHDDKKDKVKVVSK
jgi:hypothetical protein